MRSDRENAARQVAAEAIGNVINSADSICAGVSNIRVSLRENENGKWEAHASASVVVRSYVVSPSVY